MRVEISRQLRYRQFRRIIGKWPMVEVEVEVEVELHTLVDTPGARHHRNRKADAPFLKEMHESIELPQTSLVVSAQWH